MHEPYSDQTELVRVIQLIAGVRIVAPRITATQKPAKELDWHLHFI